MSSRREFAAEPAAAEGGRASVVIGRLWHTQRPVAGAFVGNAVAAVATAFPPAPAGRDARTLAGRATNVRAAGQRRAAAANGTGPDSAGSVSAGPGNRRILAGWEVTADDLLRNAGSVAGAVTVVGGATAHVGIV